MAIAQSYILIAKSGSEEDMAAALRDLAAVATGFTGSEGTRILRDRKQPNRFQFVEFWVDDDARNAAGKQLPKDVMGRIMGAVGEPPKMDVYDLV